MREIFKKFSHSTETYSLLQPNESGKSASLTYKNNGKCYTVQLPYHRRLIPKMINSRVFLHKDNMEIEITQQPGIPYIVTAEQLGGDYISVHLQDNEESEKTLVFPGSTIVVF